jgi:Domain of unknown function (DUF4159)
MAGEGARIHLVRSRILAGCTAALLVCLLAGALWAAQMPFRQYPDWEEQGAELPADYQVPGEWVFARLMYPPTRFGYRYGWNRDWIHGDTSWTIDYPRADRRIAAAVRRLTRINARSVEQPVNLDDGDDVYNWPWLYAVEVGSWELTDTQAQKLRDFLLRGGFFMVDDFHGTVEWNTFIATMNRVFPDRPIVDLDKNDPIFHTLWDMNDRFQVPGLQYTMTGLTYECPSLSPMPTGSAACAREGSEPHWRGIYDDHGRVMVVISHNMDLGDALEHADNPRYPQKYSAEGMQFFLNYIIYGMTH